MNIENTTIPDYEWNLWLEINKDHIQLLEFKKLKPIKKMVVLMDMGLFLKRTILKIK